MPQISKILVYAEAAAKELHAKYPNLIKSISPAGTIFTCVGGVDTLKQAADWLIQKRHPHKVEHKP